MSQPSPAGDTPVSFKANAFQGRGQAVEEVGKVPDLGTNVMTETTSLPKILPDWGGGEVGDRKILLLGLQDVGSGAAAEAVA